MPTLTCEISQSLWTALQRKSEETGENLSHLVSRALADTLQVEHGTLFQVSTAGAIVEGLFGGVVSVGTLREHGDFGLGTFVDLDGEMIVLDGEVYQMRSDGTIRIPDDREQVPFAIVTRFTPDETVALPAFASFKEFAADLDARRGTDNLFFALRISGRFSRLHVRIACKADEHENLVAATSHQAEFKYTDIDGTMLGYWTPEFAKGFGIPGWHLHFISDDRQHGGHVLDCAGDGLKAAFEHIDDFRVAIPETAAFLAADLTRDTTADLDKAERAH